jgi:hypothetical protein
LKYSACISELSRKYSLTVNCCSRPGKWEKMNSAAGIAAERSQLPRRPKVGGGGNARLPMTPALMSHVMLKPYRPRILSELREQNFELMGDLADL